jgi:hypothetical protein
MRILSSIVCIVALLGRVAVSEGKESPKEFSDLNGFVHRPMESGDKVGSVLVFFWHDCPISNSYAPEINRICASYTNFAFYIVQVDPDLTVAAAKQHAKEFRLSVPVLLDPQHRLVKLAKATATPEAVVLGKNGKVLYRGRIDDRHASLSQKRAVPTQQDLREALNAITAGKPVKHSTTKVIGCLIQDQPRINTNRPESK